MHKHLDFLRGVILGGVAGFLDKSVSEEMLQRIKELDTRITGDNILIQKLREELLQRASELKDATKRATVEAPEGSCGTATVAAVGCSGSGAQGGFYASPNVIGAGVWSSNPPVAPSKIDWVEADAQLNYTLGLLRTHPGVNEATYRRATNQLSFILKTLKDYEEHPETSPIVGTFQWALTQMQLEARVRRKSWRSKDYWLRIMDGQIQDRNGTLALSTWVEIGGLLATDWMVYDEQTGCT